MSEANHAMSNTNRTAWLASRPPPGNHPGDGIVTIRRWPIELHMFCKKHVEHVETLTKLDKN